MLAVIAWECVCGTHVKAMYETDGATTVRCPKPSCQVTRIVGGKVTQLWVETVDGKWTAHDVQPLVLQ